MDADPWHIEDQTSGLIYDPSSLAEATAMASALLEQGHVLRVGLGLVNARTAVFTDGVSVEELFDPCRSIGFATDQISKTLKKTSAQRALRAFFESTSSPAEAASWTAQVSLIRVPTLEELQNPASSVKRFRVHAERKNRLTFDLSRTGASSSAPTEAPSQTPALRTQTPASTPAAQQTSTSLKAQTPASTKRKRATPTRRHQAQPDVTTERLLTSEDLKRNTEVSK